jgi:hypothetical protein
VDSERQPPSVRQRTDGSIAEAYISGPQHRRVCRLIPGRLSGPAVRPVEVRADLAAKSPHASNWSAKMNMSLSFAPLIALLAGILILVVPRLLNYIVAIYLIVIGLLGLFGGSFHLK